MKMVPQNNNGRERPNAVSLAHRVVLLLIIVAVTLNIYRYDSNLTAECFGIGAISNAPSKMGTAVSSLSNSSRLAMTCWSNPCMGILGGPGTAILEELDYVVTHVDLRTVTNPASMREVLGNQDVILWWNWQVDTSISPEDLKSLRTSIDPERKQTWVLFNWDDPHVWGANAESLSTERIRALAGQLDLVYTTGSQAVASYLEAGATHAKFVLPPYSDEYHRPDIKPDLMDACDINFIGTNMYDSAKGLLSNRRSIITALEEANRHSEIKFQLYGSHQVSADLGPTSFKGPISFERNREVFSSCKLTLNLLVATASECSGGNQYANERLVTAMASGAVQLVEDHPCLQNLVENGRDVIFLKSTQPDRVIQQIKEILQNYDQYSHIRENAIRMASKWHISGFIHRIHGDILLSLSAASGRYKTRSFAASDNTGLLSNPPPKDEVSDQIAEKSSAYPLNQVYRIEATFQHYPSIKAKYDELYAYAERNIDYLQSVGRNYDYAVLSEGVDFQDKIVCEMGARNGHFGSYLTAFAKEVYISDYFQEWTDSLPGFEKASADWKAASSRPEILFPSVQDITNLTYSDESCDIVIGSSVIEHMWPQRTNDQGENVGDIVGMQELGRVLRPGGLMLLSTDMIDPTVTELHWISGTYYYNEVELIRRIVEPTGCAFVGPVDFNFHHVDNSEMMEVQGIGPITSAVFKLAKPPR